MPGRTQADEARCSFCGKQQKEVERLIATEHHRGPPSAEKWIGVRPGAPLIFICNECVDSLWEMLHDLDLQH